MKKIVLLRHGESAWNRENRFTGWTDVDLTDKGVEEALKAGELLKAERFRFGKAYTSYLKRAVRTLNCVLDRLRWPKTIPAIRASIPATPGSRTRSCPAPNRSSKPSNGRCPTGNA